MKFFFSFLITIFFAASGFAQPFTQKYIIAFHICDSACTGFQDHMVNLAESNDGTSWVLVPNFVPYQGSVPDPIIRGNKLYLYTPGKVKRYDNFTGQWDPAPVNVSVVDQNNNPVNYVDPSAIIDSAGNIVLFFLNSTGSTGDPAGCNPYPCTKYFDSAVEVTASDGTQFTLQNGNRKTIFLNSAPETASDPDIFFDGTKYILYISKGQTTLAFWSNALHGSYASFPNLSGDVLTNQGGIPCGYFDILSNNFWTYVHANISGNTVIQQAIHPNFNSQLTNFLTVISGPIIGQSATSKTESPGFCVNDFLTGINATYSQNFFSLFPNPTHGDLILTVNDSKFINAELKLYDVLGQEVFKSQIPNSKSQISLTLPYGIYFYELKDAEKIIANGKIVVQ